MSTIDMNSVAGFKAVDAEGKELGIMSLADITAAVKESIMQDAAMARSVATLSEASTLAATDTYEDRLTQKTDLTWARGLDSNGNPILISKESLASVVGELVFSYQELNSINELDYMYWDYVVKGKVYTYSKTTENLPSNFTKGTIYISRSGKSSTIQIAIDDSNKTIKRHNNTGKWSEWVVIS